MLHRLSGDIFQRQVSDLEAQYVASHIFGDSSPNRVPPELAALRADSQFEKGRSPPRPLRPLGSGETDSALGELLVI
jgi:hypothetical protein